MKMFTQKSAFLRSGNAAAAAEWKTDPVTKKRQK